MLGAFMLAACSASAAMDSRLLSEGDGSSARTDSLVYHLTRTPGMYRAYVTTTYTNRTSAPVYFARCGSQATTPMYDLRRTGPDSTARLFIDWAWGCSGGGPTGSIAPGASVTVRVPVGSIDQPRMTPPLMPENLVGTMRVVFSICKAYVSDSDYCTGAPDAERQSNAFLVVY
jgi:hypothetical protein